MEGVSKIRSTQLFCLLFVSRIITALMLMPAMERSATTVDMLPRVLIWDVLLFLCALPVFAIYDRGKSGILDYADGISPVAGKIVAALLALYFLYQNINLISGFEVFSTTVVFPEMNALLFIVVFTAVCAYIATLGLESLVRASAIVAVLTVLVVGMLLATLIPQIRAFNFAPLFYDGVSPVFQSAFRSLANTSEIAVLAVIMPHATGRMKRTYGKWMAWISIAILVLSFFAVGALGAFASTQIFPFYTLAEIASIGVFQRLDAVMTSVWVACAAVKSSLFLYLFSHCIRRTVPRGKKNIWILGGALITALCVSYISLDENRYIAINQYVPSIAIFAAVVLVIPLLLLLTGTIRQRRLRKEGEA
ncbi:MAG: GerAB/ArcD/ProY family transporter [Clostridia bacterium]